MYSNNQWSFNPAAYQNIPYEQVDWASLAQQWIKMKETVPTTTEGPAPPPAPLISKTTETLVPTSNLMTSQSNNDIEGGEAPMDMDTKDDEVTSTSVGAAVATSGNWNHWGNWQSQWGWGWSGNSGSAPSTDSTASATSNIDSKVKSTNNDSIAALNDVRNFPLVGNSATTTQVSSTFNYNNTGGTVMPPTIPKSNYGFNNVFSSGSKNLSDNWQRGSKSSNRQAPQKAIPPEQFSVIDAAKKKQLPAWIRDGLNKMEREKQKKMEKERMVQEKYIIDQMKSDHVDPETALIPIYVEKSPFRDPSSSMQDHLRRHSPDPASSSKYQKRRSPSIPRQRSREPQTLRKTKDQIMEESMLKVRRILTEILLEATEKQVHLIAKEEHRRYRTSASAPQIRKSNALTSLTGNLGLDVYDSEDNSTDGERDRDDFDSDEELKMTIEKKKRDFTLVEDEIERVIEDQEVKERLIAQRDTKDDNDIDDEGNEDDEEDELRTRNNRDKDSSASLFHHQRYPDYEKERQSSGVESRSFNDDRNDYRNRRNLSTGSESKQMNGDSKPGSVSATPSGTSGSIAAPVEDPERSKKDSSFSSSNSNTSSSNHNTSKSHHSTKRSLHRSRSSSSSSSSSASSSSSSSSDDSRSSSDDDDDSASGGEAYADDSKSKFSKSKKDRKSRKKSDTGNKSSSKRSKRHSFDDSDSGGGGSRKRSSSRSRYYDGKSSSLSKRTSSRNTGSVEKSRRRRSPSYRRRSPSYHKSSRREHSSKYKYSSSRSRRRGDNYSPESKRSRYRSSSKELSRYKRR